MASKSKLKLKKKEFRVEGKIINLERFAYDVFAYSTSKFGVPADCICKWKDGENDYGLPNFIVVLSRFIFRCQVKERNNWYTEFKPYYESTKFKSFDSIVPALQRVMYETASFGRGLIHYEVIVTLALISELILFLYAENCLLYIQELVHYWFECWFSRKKELEKSGGFADLYQKFNNPEEAKVDIFFSEFIPAYCIPYNGSRSLQDVFDQEFNKFFHLSAKNISDMEKAVREEAARKDAIIQQLAAQLSTACVSSRQRVETSRANKPRNTGLGIQTHEELLRNVLGADTETSPDNIQRKGGQISPRVRRETAGKKERQKKLSSPQSNIAGVEPLKTHVVGVEAAISNVDEDSENETPSNTGLGIQTHDDLLRSIFGTDATSPKDSEESQKNFQRKSGQKLPRDRRGTTGKKERHKKLSSPHSTGTDVEPLKTFVLGAEATIPAVEDSGSKMPRNTGLGMQTREDLLQAVLGADPKASPENVQSKSERKLARNRSGTTGKKDTQKKLSSPLSAVTDVEPLKTVVVGAEAAIPAVENSKNKTPRNTGLGIQTHEDLLRDVLGANPEASPENVQSGQKLARDRRGTAGKKERQKKSYNVHSTRADFERLKTGVVGAEASIPAVDIDSEGEIPSNAAHAIEIQDYLLRKFLGTYTTSPQDPSSISCERTAEHRRVSSSQEKASLTLEKLEQLHTNVLGAEAAISPFFEESGIKPRVNTSHADFLRNAFGTRNVSPQEQSNSSHQKTTKGCKGFTDKKEIQKKLANPCSTLTTPESLKRKARVSDSTTSLLSHLSANPQKGVIDYVGSLKQEEIQKTEVQSSSNEEDVARTKMRLEKLIAELLDSKFEMDKTVLLDIQTQFDLLGDVVRTDTLSSAEELSSTTLPKQSKDLEVISGHKEVQEKSNRPRPSSDDLEYLGLPLPPKAAKDIKCPSTQKKIEESETSSNPFSDNLEPYYQYLGLPFPAKTTKDFSKSPRKDEQNKKPCSHPASVDLEFPGLPLAAKLDDDLQDDLPKNSGLGVHTQEDLLRDAFGANISSRKDISSANSQKVEAIRRESHAEKKRMKKVTSPRIPIEASESLETSPLKIGFSTSQPSISGESSQRTERHRTGSYCQKDKQKKTSSCRSSMEGLQRLKTSPIESSYAISPQHLSRPGYIGTESSATGSSSQENIQEIKSSPSSSKDHKRSRTSPLDVRSTTSLQHIYSESSQRTESDRTGSSSQKNRLNKASSRISSLKGFESLKTGLFRSDFAASPQSLSSACLEITERDQTRSTQKYIQKVKSDPISTKKDPESSRTSQEIESDRTVSSSQKDRQKKTPSSYSPLEAPESLKISLSGAGTTSPLHISSASSQRTERDRTELLSQQDRLKKTSSPHSSFEGLEHLKTGLFGSVFATSPLSLSSACLEITERDQTRSSTQKYIQKVKYNPISTKKDPESSRTSPWGIEVEESLRNIEGSSIQKDKQKKTSTSCLEGPEPLKTVSSGAASATSQEHISSACLQIPERYLTGSSSQKDIQEGIPSQSSTTEGPEPSRTSPLGAAAPTSPGNIEDSSIQTLKDTDLWSMTPQQMIQLLFGDKAATLDAK